MGHSKYRVSCSNTIFVPVSSEWETLEDRCTKKYQPETTRDLLEIKEERIEAEKIANCKETKGKRGRRREKEAEKERDYVGVQPR